MDLYATAGECFYNSLKEEPGLAFKKKQQRQAAREARIPINAGRLYN